MFTVETQEFYDSTSKFRQIMTYRYKNVVFEGASMIVETLFQFMQKIMLFSSFVNNTSSFPKPLTEKEEAMYLEKAKEGDKEASDTLIRHNLRLVAHIVKKYSGSLEADDLISVGCYGLIKAINTYQLGHGTQLSTYAAKCIENEILMLIRQNKRHKNTMSIEEVLGSDEDNNEITLSDIMCDTDIDVEQNVYQVGVSQKLDVVLKETLTKREYQIIAMRYGLGGQPMLTQREVAEKLKISRSYISRLEKKALQELKSVIKKEDYFA